MGLPLDDPLRFDERGERLPKDELDVLLDGIIESWPTWDRTPRPPAPRASLSGEREVCRRREWLSR